MTDLLTLYRQAEEFLIARGKEQLFRNNPDAATWTSEKVRNCLAIHERDVAAVAQTMALKQVVQAINPTVKIVSGFTGTIDGTDITAGEFTGPSKLTTHELAELYSETAERVEDLTSENERLTRLVAASESCEECYYARKDAEDE